MEVKTLKNCVAIKQRELSTAQKQLDNKKQQLVEFEKAIEQLEAPVLATVGTSPTETMNQIIGDAQTLEEKRQRLATAKQAASEHYEQIAALQKSVTKLQSDVALWEGKLDWAENYEQSSEELRHKWISPQQFTNQIQHYRQQITNIEKAITQRSERISNWSNERQQIINMLQQQGMGKKHLDENTPNDLAEQNSSDIKHIEYLQNLITDVEQRLENDFKQFVRNQVDRRKALTQLRPDLQRLEDILQEHRAAAKQLQTKLTEFPILKDFIIPIPEEINFE